MPKCNFNKVTNRMLLMADVPQNRWYKSSANSTGKHLCRSHFLIKLQGSDCEIYLLINLKLLYRAPR